MAKRILQSQIMVPIVAARPLAVTSEVISVAAGAAGTIKDFFFTRKPILDSHNSWIGGFGDTSITGIGTVFTNEVAAYTPDTALANGDYWIDYVTGRGRGKKATTGTSITATYQVLTSTSDLTNGGTVNGDLDVTGDFSVSGAFSVGTLVTDTIIIDADDTEAFLVRKDGDLGDIFAVDTINGQVKAAVGTALLPAYTFFGDVDTGFYHKAANTIGFVANASEIGSWTTGALALASGHVSYAAGVAVTADSYSVGRDADATNQLHLNVPTGATFEFSVNDVAEMTLSATALNLQNNSLTTTGGGSLTGTWSDLGTVTTIDINGGTLDGVVVGGAVAAAGTFTSLNANGGGALTGTWSNLGTVTTIDINGGTLDGTVIGGASAAAATFTTVSQNNLTTYSAGAAITAGSYQIGRDADATNQLHFNVPTGAGYEWSINDAAIVTLTNTTLSTSTALSFAVGTTVTAAAWQIFRDTTATPNFLSFNVPTNSGYGFYVNGVVEAYQSASGLIQMAGNNYKLFNTADIVTNTESVSMDWSGNVARIYTFPTGTGVARPLSISAFNSSAGGGTITWSSSTPYVSLTHSSTSVAGFMVGYSGVNTASSSTTNFFYINPTVNQSSTAGYNATSINVTETTVGSGTRNIASWQVSSTERFGFRTDGAYVQTPKVLSSGLPVAWTLTGAAHTGLTNSVYRDVYLNLNRSVGFSGGGGAIQYSAGMEVTGISFSAASAQSIGVIAAAMFTGCAIAGSNVTATYQATRYSIFGTGKSANMITDGLQMPGIDTSVGAVTSVHGYAVHAGQASTSLGDQTATLDRLASFYNDAITYVSTTNTRTVTEAAGAYFNAPIAGTNVSFTSVYGAIVKTGGFKISAGRLSTAKGANVASANDLFLGSDGNLFNITGTTQINAIGFAGWAGGVPVVLYFASGLTVKHNTSGGAGTAPILLSGSADLTTATNTVLVIFYDGTNWQEMSRKAA